VNSHYSADVATKVSTTGSDGQVLAWIESLDSKNVINTSVPFFLEVVLSSPICVNHEIPVVFIYPWRLALIDSTKKLGKTFRLKFVDLVHVEPSGVGRDYDWMELR
jgi:hypothetical protein